MKTDLFFRKSAIVVLVSAAFLLLSACKFDLTADVYLSDIIDLPHAGEPVFAPAVISFSNPSDDKKQPIIDLLNAYFLSVENVRVENADSGDTMMADIKIPLVMRTDDGASAETPFELVVDAKADRYEVCLRLNKAVWDRLNAGIGEIISQSLSLKESGLTFTVINDQKKSEALEFSSVYVDDKPIPYAEKTEIERKESVEVRLSNVLQDTLDGDGVNRIRIFSLMK